MILIFPFTDEPGDKMRYRRYRRVQGAGCRLQSAGSGMLKSDVVIVDVVKGWSWPNPYVLGNVPTYLNYMVAYYCASRS